MEARRLNMAHAAAKQRECKVAASAAAAPGTVIEEEEEEDEEATPPGEGDDQQSALGEGDGSKNGEDMSSEKGRNYSLNVQ